MESRVAGTGFRLSKLSFAVHAIAVGIPLVTLPSGAFAQEVFDVTGPDNPQLFLSVDNLPDGATINVLDGAGINSISIQAPANPDDLASPPPININVAGSVGSPSFDTVNFDIVSRVPGTAVDNTGAISNLFLSGGATIVNDGVIAMAPGDSGASVIALFLETPPTGNTGVTSSYQLTNTGSISISGENLSGGVFGSGIVAAGGQGTVPSNVSLTLDNSGSISLGPDATGFVTIWSGADDIVVNNTGIMDAGFTVNAGGVTQEPILLTRTVSNTPGLVFDDNISITNASGGQMRGAAIFVHFLDGSENYNLRFQNDGDIVASGGDLLGPTAGGGAFQTGGLTSFTNTGSIRVDGSLLEGGTGGGDFMLHFVDFFGTPDQGDFDSQALTFLNSASGVIDADATGIEFQAGTITNDGTIISRAQEDAYGIFATVNGLIGAPQDQWNDSVDVVNNGLIQAGFVGVSKADGVINLNLTNTGTIEVIAPTPFLPSAIDISEGSMSITNSVSGIIRGPNAVLGTGESLDIDNDGLIEGEILFAGSATINNRGTIDANGAAFSLNLIGDSPDSLTNSGSIIGDVQMGSGNDTVRASGLFDGTVFLGDGDDTFIAEGGLTVTGSVLGGNGFDTLRLINGGFASGPDRINALFQEFDAAFLGGSFSLGGDNLASDIALTAPTLEFEPGTTFIVDAFEDGTSDILRNTGAITLNGGQVQALSNDGTWSVARQYTIIQSDTSVTGTFDSVTSNLEYLDPSLSYTPTSVILSLERIDGLIQGDILETTNAQQLSVAARVVPQIIQTQVSNSIGKLLGAASASSAVVASPIALATGLSAGDETDPDTGATGSAWLNLTPTRYDQRAVLPGASGLQEIDGDTLNFLAGVDRLVGSRAVIGGFVGYEDSEVDYRAIQGLQESDGYLFGAYAGLAFNSWLYSSINVNWAQLDNALEERAFDSPEVQEANYDSERLSASVDLTAVMQRGSMRYRAQAAYNYSDESYDRYTTNRGEVIQLEDLSLGRFSITGEASYQGELWNPYLALTYEIDTEVSDTVEDDNGLLVNAGLRAVRGERLTFEAYIATVTSRNNENQELLGLNINYAF